MPRPLRPPKLHKNERNRAERAEKVRVDRRGKYRKVERFLHCMTGLVLDEKNEARDVANFKLCAQYFVRSLRWARFG